jgi:hypothetical protein
MATMKIKTIVECAMAPMLIKTIVVSAMVQAPLMVKTATAIVLRMQRNLTVLGFKLRHRRSFMTGRMKPGFKKL